MRWIWNVETDESHEIRLELDYLGREKVFVDGVLASRNRRMWTQHNQHLFAVGAGHRARLDVHGSWAGRVTCRLLVNGRVVPPLGGGPKEGWLRLAKEMPAWGWVFAAACLAIPVVSLGGAISAFLGVMGAGISISIAADRDRSEAMRILLATATTMVCWGAFLGAAFWLSGAPDAAPRSEFSAAYAGLVDSIVTVEVTGGDGVVSRRSGVIVAHETVVTILPEGVGSSRLLVRHKLEERQAHVRYFDPERLLAQIEVPGLGGTPATLGATGALIAGQRLLFCYAGTSDGAVSQTSVDVRSLQQTEGAQLMSFRGGTSDRETSGGGLFDEARTLVGIYRKDIPPPDTGLPVEWIALLSGYPVDR